MLTRVLRIGYMETWDEPAPAPRGRSHHLATGERTVPIAEMRTALDAATARANEPRPLEAWRKGAIYRMLHDGISARAVAAIYNVNECDVPHIATAFERAQWQHAGLLGQDEDEVDAREKRGNE